jgi:hypothetical protein
MQLFSHAHRPVHLGPYPAERLGRTAEAADCRKVSQQGAASGQQAEVTALIFDVCFTPTSDIRLTVRHFRFGPNSEVATPLMGSRRERGEPCAGTFFILRQFVASGHTARSFYNVIATGLASRHGCGLRAYLPLRPYAWVRDWLCLWLHGWERPKTLRRSLFLSLCGWRQEPIRHPCDSRL